MQINLKRLGQKNSKFDYEQGRSASITVRALAPVSTVSQRFWRFRLPDLWLSRWPRNGLRHFALPLAVAVNRFLIPLWVFCLGIVIFPSSWHLNNRYYATTQSQTDIRGGGSISIEDRRFQSVNSKNCEEFTHRKKVPKSAPIRSSDYGFIASAATSKR